MAGLAGVRPVARKVGGVPAVYGCGNAEALSGRLLPVLAEARSGMAGAAVDHRSLRVRVHQMRPLMPVVHFQNGGPGVRMTMGAAESRRHREHGGAFRQHLAGGRVLGPQRDHRIGIERPVGAHGAYRNRGPEKGLLHGLHASAPHRGAARQPDFGAHAPRHLHAFRHDLRIGRAAPDELRVEFRFGIVERPDVVRRGGLVKALQPRAGQHILLRSGEGHVRRGHRARSGQAVQHRDRTGLHRGPPGAFFGRCGEKDPAETDQKNRHGGQPDRQGPTCGRGCVLAHGASGEGMRGKATLSR